MVCVPVSPKTKYGTADWNRRRVWRSAARFRFCVCRAATARDESGAAHGRRRRAHAQGCIAKTVPEYLPQTVCEKDGAETALSTYALGVLEAELTDALRKSLNGTAKAFVPLGNLTGLMLLNGRGMKIPVRFSVESAVSVRFESVLTGAGINRTAYRTVLHIEAVLFTGGARRGGACDGDGSIPRV